MIWQILRSRTFLFCIVVLVLVNILPRSWAAPIAIVAFAIWWLMAKRDERVEIADHLHKKMLLRNNVEGKRREVHYDEHFNIVGYTDHDGDKSVHYDSNWNEVRTSAG